MSEIALWVTLLVLVGVASFLLGMLVRSVIRDAGPLASAGSGGTSGSASPSLSCSS